MRRSSRTTLLIALSVILIIVVLVILRAKAPPEVARLLPESDAVLYLDLKPLRAATHYDKTLVTHDAAYQKFIDGTGFQFERDLNEAAFALQRMPDPTGPNGPVAFSEVFEGHFDRKRLAAYLQSVSASQETYGNHAIFLIPSDQRTVRVTILSYDMVAVSNTPTPEQIHSIIDRSRTAALPFAGSSLLSDNYGKVPALSLAWAIGKVEAPLWKNGGPKVFGVRIPISTDTTFIASVRWLGSAKLRIEELAPNQGAADASANTVNMFLTLAKGAENSLPGFLANPDYREILNSTQIDRKGTTAVLTATLPDSLLKQLAQAPDKLSGSSGSKQ
jgi:hypothetical protein